MHVEGEGKTAKCGQRGPSRWNMHTFYPVLCAFFRLYFSIDVSLGRMLALVWNMDLPNIQLDVCAVLYLWLICQLANRTEKLPIILPVSKFKNEHRNLPLPCAPPWKFEPEGDGQRLTGKPTATAKGGKGGGGERQARRRRRKWEWNWLGERKSEREVEFKLLTSIFILPWELEGWKCSVESKWWRHHTHRTEGGWTDGHESGRASTQQGSKVQFQVWLLPPQQRCCFSSKDLALI